MIAPIEISEIPVKRTYIGSAKEDVLTFARSGAKAGRVIMDGVNPYKAQGYYSEAIKRLNMQMKTMIRNKELFILRADVS